MEKVMNLFIKMKGEAKRLVPVCLMAVMPWVVSAQKQWTLQECIDYAMQNNITLQKARLSQQSAAEDVKGAKGALLPTLSASANQSFGYRPWQDAGTTTVTNGTVNTKVDKTYLNGSYGINAQWTVWNGNRNTNTLKVNRLSEQMSELEVQGVVTRLAKGIYCKPRMTRFGPLYPDVRTIVEAVALRDHAQVLPSGATAANRLGLSEQVPMKNTFITSGSSKVLTVGKQEVRLQRAVPRNFAYRTQLAALMVQALKATGKQNVGNEELWALKRAIDANEEKEAFRQDVMQMPIWMKKILMPLL